MQNVQEMVRGLFQIDSIWSVVLRAAIWLGIGVVVIISTDTANFSSSQRSLKKNLGLFLLFILLSVGLIYLLFGFIANPITPSK